MNRGVSFITGIGLGAGFWCLFDPKQGARRRDALGKKLSRLLNRTADTMEKSSRNIQKLRPSRSGGDRSPFLEESQEKRLVERIEAKLRSVVPEPSALTILVSGGRVTLIGPILSRDVEPLLSAVSSESGVTDIENRLHIYGEIADLSQGKSTAPSRRVGAEGPKRSMVGRVVVGAAGLALALYGMRRQGGIAHAVGAIGLGLLSRGLDDAPVTALRESDSPRHVIDVRKSLQVAAPPARVFQFWENPENFSRFISFVHEVKKADEGRFHWKIFGPGGEPLEWDTAVTEKIPNERLRWESVAGAGMEHAGTVRLRATPAGNTQLEAQFHYKFPFGPLGEVMSSMFGPHPEKRIWDDLMRMKSIIENESVSNPNRPVRGEPFEKSA